MSVWTAFERDGLIDVQPTPYLCSSGVFGRLIGLAAFVVSLPVVAVLILLVRLTSRGPGLYRQVRVGKDGCIFVMYKLRSMVQDAEKGTGPVWTQEGSDPRITPLGVFLRKSHLDELPQLLNVVRGEMSLFGPRPERPELVHVLADNVSGYLNRLSVRPGITGLAQINLPPDTDLESVRRKLILDLEYIDDANLWLDIRMFLWTCLRLVAVPSSIATRIFGLGRNVAPVKSRKSGPVTIAEVLQSTQANDDIQVVASVAD